RPVAETSENSFAPFFTGFILAADPPLHSEVAAPGPARAPLSARHEIFYLTETTVAAVHIDDFKYRFNDQPGVGSAPPRRSTGRSWSISASIHMSAPASSMARTTVRSPT